MEQSHGGALGYQDNALVEYAGYFNGPVRSNATIMAEKIQSTLVEADSVSAPVAGITSLKATTVEAGSFKYPTQKTSQLVLPRISFKPPNSYVDYQDFDGIYITGAAEYNDNVFYAKLELPQGAVINTIEYYYKDEFPSANIEFKVTASNIATNTSSIFFSYTSSGTPGKTKATVTGSHTIDNNNRYYLISAFVANWASTVKAGISVYGAVVTYTLTGPQ